MRIPAPVRPAPVRLAPICLATTCLALAALVAGSAQGGGIERSPAPYSILWEEGNYAQLSFGHVAPRVSGSWMGLPSGNALDDYTQFSLGVKFALGDRLDLALVLDEPIGADTVYPAAAFPYPIYGATGILHSRALSLLVRYRFDNGFSLHGGLVAQRTSGESTLPGWGYTMEARPTTDAGYLVGIAWERPEIALRVALTWQSAITHRFTTIENGAPSEPFTTEMPQALTLDFQSGVAPDTLVFGSIRWRDWSAFDISPVEYARLGFGPLASYDHDSITWTLGLGHRFSESWSAALSLAHERHFGTPVGNLGPVDGMTSVTLGASYTRERMRLSAGVTYAWLGHATTQVIGARFAGNHALGVGVSVGYGF